MAEVHTRSLREGVLKIKDATPVTPNEIAVAFSSGNLSWTQTKNLVNILDRGVLGHVRQGDQAPVRVTFSTRHLFMLSDSADAEEKVSPYEALTQSGEAAAWVSTGLDGEPYACLLEYWSLNPDDAGNDEKIAFAKCRLTSFTFNEGDDANEIAIEVEDFEVAPTITRAAYA